MLRYNINQIYCMSPCLKHSNIDVDSEVQALRVGGTGAEKLYEVMNRLLRPRLINLIRIRAVRKFAIVYC